MTERADTTDQAERIRRLQERRAASGGSRAAANGHRPATPTPAGATKAGAAKAAPAGRASGKRRRRHPAAASRILLAGLSVASFFTIGGSLALAQNNAATVATTPAAVVGPVAPNGTATSTAASATPATASANSSKQTAPVVHTRTKAS